MQLINLQLNFYVGDEILQYYRVGQRWKKLVPNLAKGLVLAGTAVMLCNHIPSTQKQQTIPFVMPGFSLLSVSTNRGPLPACGPLPLTVADAFVTSADSDIFLIQPTEGVLTSSFGPRWGRNHDGIDIGGAMDTPILAAATGTVKLSQWVDGYGYYILLEHENGYQTAYAHCNRLLVNAGDWVRQGETIAQMGSTGNSTGPHLHFEVKVDGILQDPLNYVLY